MYCKLAFRDVGASSLFFLECWGNRLTTQMLRMGATVIQPPAEDCTPSKIRLTLLKTIGDRAVNLIQFWISEERNQDNERKLLIATSIAEECRRLGLGVGIGRPWIDPMKKIGRPYWWKTDMPAEVDRGPGYFLKYDPPPVGFTLVTYDLCCYQGTIVPFGPLPKDKVATVPRVPGTVPHDYHLGPIIEDLTQEEESLEREEDVWSKDELSKYEPDTGSMDSPVDVEMQGQTVEVRRVSATQPKPPSAETMTAQPLAHRKDEEQTRFVLPRADQMHLWSRIQRRVTVNTETKQVLADEPTAGKAKG